MVNRQTGWEGWRHSMLKNGGNKIGRASGIRNSVERRKGQCDGERETVHEQNHGKSLYHC